MPLNDSILPKHLVRVGCELACTVTTVSKVSHQLHEKTTMMYFNTSISLVMFLEILKLCYKLKIAFNKDEICDPKQTSSEFELSPTEEYTSAIKLETFEDGVCKLLYPE